jgi:hypothetical protein
MGLDNDDNFFKNNGYFYPVTLKSTGSFGTCKYTESRKNYEEAKSRALTLANETLSSDTAKQSCKNFLATLLKYGFCNKSFRKDEPLNSCTLLGGFAGCKTKSLCRY